jgi:hypothetical protein
MVCKETRVLDGSGTFIGFRMCIQEPSLFIYQQDDGNMILNTSTDNFLCAYSDTVRFDKLCKWLERFFEITSKTGSLLNYLNLCIIQSELGVSYDQTDHIRKMVKKHFPPEKIGDSKTKTVHTPFRTDTQYEKDLMEQLPVKGKDLNTLVEKYCAPFSNSILGDIMHVVVWSRFDCGYATKSLSKYSHAPNEAAFAGLKWKAMRNSELTTIL